MERNVLVSILVTSVVIGIISIFMNFVGFLLSVIVGAFLLLFLMKKQDFLLDKSSVFFLTLFSSIFSVLFSMAEVYLFGAGIDITGIPIGVSIFLEFLLTFFLFQILWFTLLLNKFCREQVAEENSIFEDLMTLKAMLLSAVVLSVVSSVAFFFIVLSSAQEMEILKIFLTPVVGVVTFIFVLCVLFFPYLYLKKFRESRIALLVCLSLEGGILYLLAPVLVALFVLLFGYGIYTGVMPFGFYVGKTIVFAVLYLLVVSVFTLFSFSRIVETTKRVLLIFFILGMFIPLFLGFTYIVLESPNSREEIGQYLLTAENNDVQAFNTAILSSDFQTCSEVSYFMLRSSCQYKVAALLNNPLLCKSVGESGWQGVCYGYFAYKTGDKEYCKLITEEYKRGKCEIGEESVLYGDKFLRELETVKTTPPSY